jgi:hypothetical protein
MFAGVKDFKSYDDVGVKEMLIQSETLKGSEWVLW